MVVCLALAACGRFGFDPSGGDDQVQAPADAATDGAAAAATTLWLLGGSDGATQAQVWRSDDGRTWTQVGTLPAPRSRGAVFYLNGSLVFAGGAMGVGNAFTEIWQSPDGVTWNQIGNLPLPLAGMGYGAFQGRLWLIGGETTGGTSTDVVRSSVDGVTWQTVGNVPYPVHGGVLVAHAGRMYLVAGHNGAFLNTVISSADGVTWTPEPSLTSAREYHGCAEIAGAVWAAGGTPSANDVRTLGTSSWPQIGTLPISADHTFLTSYRGSAWLISGAVGDVLSSADGATWVDEGNLPGPRSYFNALATPPL
jgi:hypothetical protein